jgi:hypothetical protein
LVTPEQRDRFIAAWNNFEDLVGPEDFNQLVEDTIKMLTGKAGTEDDDMARKKGTKNKPKDETANGNQQVSSVTVPQQDRDQLIAEWKRAADQLSEFKEKEHALRQALVAQLFDGTKLEGAETIDLGYGGWQLRATKEQAYNATNKEGQTDKLLDILEKRDRDLADKLVSWKPDISKPSYRQVLALAQQYNDNEVLSALHEAITVKPGMPQLEMIPPKTDEPAAVVSAGYPIDVVPSNQLPVFTLEENFLPED